MTDTATVERTTTDLLKAQVFAAYQSRKFTAIWDLFEMQIALNTQCEIDNAALREAYDELRKESICFASAVSSVEDMEPHVLDAYGALLDVLYPPDALVTFATDHGIPLPGEGVGS